jgi:hypothetical protein
MKTTIFRTDIYRITVLAIFAAAGLTGCGGTKMLKEPEPLGVPHSLASASDQRLRATIDRLIVRDGPGTWARNADWDEYQIRVTNMGDESLQITSVTVTDSLGTLLESGESRKQLVKGAKETKRRYKGAGIEVKAGWGAGTILTVGAVGFASVASAAGAAGMLTTGGAVAATGGLILVPAMAMTGVMRGVNNRKVNKEIESRQTTLPVDVLEHDEKALDIFFPLAPSPQQVEIRYVDAEGAHALIIDTSTALDGLHLVNTNEE